MIADGIEPNGWKQYQRLVLAEVERGANERAEITHTLQRLTRAGEARAKQMEATENQVSEFRHEFKNLEDLMHRNMLEQQKERSELCMEIESVKVHLKITWALLTMILGAMIANLLGIFP